MNVRSRRQLLRGMAGAAAAAVLAPWVGAQTPKVLTRAIPSSGEAMPVVGLGTWITFNVGNDPVLKEQCVDVMRAFFADGGRMIDSSPMYGSSQQVIGYGLNKLGMPSQLFSADKVWTSSAARGAEQIEATRAHWGVPRLDLVQVHNLLAWQPHLATLFEMKKDGRIRYVGITTSEGRRHREIEQIMARHPIDFVQVTYNVLDREVEARILPLARERKIGVIVNRPFRQGDLIRAIERKPLPAWAADFDCTTWAQVLLKFIVAHPDVTCVIPATTRVDHLHDNMRAARGRMPDAGERKRIVAHVERL